MFHCSLHGHWILKTGEGIARMVWAWEPLNEGRGQNGRKGEKYKINEIKKDIDEHSVSVRRIYLTDYKSKCKGQS